MKFAFLSSYAHLALDRTTGRVSGGAELQVALLARELVRAGHEAVILGADEGQPDARMLDGVRTRTGGRFHTGGIWNTLRAFPRVFRVLREERPDYVCVLGWTAWLGFLLRARRFAKLVYICGSDAEVDGAYRRANRLRGTIFERGLRRADQRFAMSEHQRACLARAGLGCGFYRNLILPRSAPREAERTIDFLWVSRCIPLKRPHLFLDLAAALPDARFAMIAPAEDRPLWETVRSRATTLPNVEFHERVPYHEVQPFFDRAEVFVNTSEFEGFPNTFIQAGQGGATVLSLLVDPDRVLSGFGAGRCAQGEWGGMLAAACELLQDRAAREALQARCAQFVAEWHDNARNVAAFLEGLPQ